MKRFCRYLFLLLCLCRFGGALYAQDEARPQFQGRWWLAVLKDVSLPLNLYIHDDTLLLYSPMQSSVPMHPSRWSFAGDTLKAFFKQQGIRLTLLYDASADNFSGTFSQQLLRSQIVFGPADGLFVINRPQTPKPPFPYHEEEFVVSRRRAGVSLVGTLSLPEGDGPFPAVVLVSGSGQQNRDEEIFGHKPFAVIADYLVRRGIAVARYDDRGVGGSTGDLSAATTLDFADDAEAVFSYLRTHKHINPRQVGIIGHSEGAAIAALIASRNRKVAFAVMLAGQGGTGADALLQQNERFFRLQGVPDSLVSRRLAAYHELFDAIDTVADDDMASFVTTIFARYSAGLTKDECASIALGKYDAFLAAKQLSMPWMRTFLSLDMAPALAKLKCPLLALNGSNDCQVLPSNLSVISAATQGHADTVLLDGLNHLFQNSTTGATDEYMLIDETFDMKALSIIHDWLRAVLKKE